jgi:hypothetical protein
MNRANEAKLMAKKKKKTTHKVDAENRSICGIVMPISAIDGCSELHWADVLEILTDAIEDAGFDAKNPVVVCDVSGKNPNVMFELGLRLAFDNHNSEGRQDILYLRYVPYRAP